MNLGKWLCGAGGNEQKGLSLWLTENEHGSGSEAPGTEDFPGSSVDYLPGRETDVGVTSFVHRGSSVAFKEEAGTGYQQLENENHPENWK